MKKLITFLKVAEKYDIKKIIYDSSFQIFEKKIIIKMKLSIKLLWIIKTISEKILTKIKIMLICRF